MLKLKLNESQDWGSSTAQNQTRIRQTSRRKEKIQWEGRRVSVLANITDDR